MATFLDVSALENFSVIFVFLLAWLGGYAMTLYVRLIQNQFLNIIISLLFAIFVVISPLATLIFKTIAPIIAVVMFLVVIGLSASGMFGKVDIESASGLKWVALVIVIIAVVVATASIVSENIEIPERGEDFGKISTVLLHPNFLGMILLLGIAIFTIALLAYKQT